MGATMTVPDSTEGATPKPEAPKPGPPAQAETDWKAEARKWEERAKTNTAAATRLAELEEANKSEIDKAMDKVSKAEAEVATVPAKVASALRTYLVALEKVDQEDADLFLTASDPELLVKQMQRLIGRESDRKKQGNHVPREGANPTATASEGLETVRALFGGG